MASSSEQQKITAAIGSAFNAILLEAFLCGLYTLLFAYTLQKLLRKKNRKGHAAVLTLLWLLVIVTFAFDWNYHRTAFVIDNDSPLDIVIAVVGESNPTVVGFLDNIFSTSCNWLADTLLVWRCYILWEDKRWALLPLPILLIANVVLGTLSVVPLFSERPTEDGFIFLISFFTISIAITFTGTLLIIIRILLVTRRSPLTTHTSAYRNIQIILLESGIIYTIALFIADLTLVIELIAHKDGSIPLNELITYTEAIIIPLSGIAPTLITVRIGREGPLQTGTEALSHSYEPPHLTYNGTAPMMHSTKSTVMEC